MLAGAGFANADRLKRFLEFTVEMKLRGEEGQIKEFLLGQEVFDRGAGYDPRLDPIVRVEARRLRQRLAEYYSGPGQDEPLRIEFPKGSYAPSDPCGCGGEERPGLSRRGSGKAVAGCVERAHSSRRCCHCFACKPLSRCWPSYPHAGCGAVIPPLWTRWMRASPKRSRRRSPGAEPSRLPRGRVVIRHRGRSLEVRALGERLGVREILIVAARAQPAAASPGGLRITVFLMDAATGQKRWVEEYSRSHSARQPPRGGPHCRGPSPG